MVDKAFSSESMLDMAAAKITATTVELYADRKGWDVGELEVSVEAEGSLVRGDAAYHVIVDLPGDLSDEQCRRILTIAGKCPVDKAIAGEFPISVTATEA